MLKSMIRTPGQQKFSRNNEYLILTTVAGDKNLVKELIKLDRETIGITVLANEKWRSQVEKLLRQDILKLSMAAALCIICISIFAFRNGRSVAGVLAPVLSALSAMSLFSFLSSGELNMMHLLMGIMVIGLSVDYGIFMICESDNKKNPVSAYAVSVCAASSLIGFGVLAFAQHPALHSLGITVLVGIGSAWPTALFVSPLLAGTTAGNKK